MPRPCGWLFEKIKPTSVTPSSCLSLCLCLSLFFWVIKAAVFPPQHLEGGTAG